jgi:hypothetical protein
MPQGVHSLLELGTARVHDLEINTLDIQEFPLLKRMIYVQCVARKSPQIHKQVRNE